MPSAPKLLLCLLLASAGLCSAAAPTGLPEPGSDDPPIKYAIYSSAWSENSNAGLRIVAQNQTEGSIELVALIFRDETDPQIEVTVQLDLDVPARGWAERQLPYIDLIFGNSCIRETMEEDWRLVEISNYTLNPSVRGLIIEDTDSFRIYQCVRAVHTVWVEQGESHEQAEWVLYHYERQPRTN